MLWYKAWLELRLRLVLAGGMACFVVWRLATSPKPQYLAAAQNPQTATFLEPALRTALAAHSPGFIALWLGLYYHMMPALLTVLAIAFASAGLKTQTPFANARESHPSMFFTLSLPVSRASLLFTRAVSGLIAVVILALLMSVTGIVGTGQTPGGADVFLLVAGIVLGAAVFYSMSALLSVYLADLWQIYAGYAVFGAYMYLQSTVNMPAALDMFRLMNGELYLTTGQLPFATITVAIIIIAMFFTATLWCMRKREF